MYLYFVLGVNYVVLDSKFGFTVLCEINVADIKPFPYNTLCARDITPSTTEHQSAQLRASYTLHPT